MSGLDAIKFLSVHFLETWKEILDEDLFDSAMTIMENTESKKLIKKIIKLMRPFDKITKMEEVTPEQLQDLGIFKDPFSITEEQIGKLIDQANFCRNACFAVDQMDPAMLAQIENIAGVLQESVGNDLGSEEVKNEDVSNLLSSLVTSVSSAGNNPENILTNLECEINKSTVSDEIKGVIPKMLETIKNATNEKEFDENDFLQKFNAIDGVSKTLKRE
ncbi:MAG: hypothetical protein CMB64_04950 [Euryarchaeota archaeon]|nr:hypothetical protein [Euryarchaeota archaeon]|tara:strand:+ start:405 stop:1058 length:654 start_codon:yes stop_codon:yes gene_type:complete